MSPNTRQQKLERKAAKRKAKQKAVRAAGTYSGHKAYLRQAATWPVLECWANQDWRDPTKLNQVILARRNPLTGEVAMASFLVDRACLGIKNALAARFVTAQEFRTQYLANAGRNQALSQVDVNLAAAIVKAGLEYAASLKFRPHRDYTEAAILLGDADPSAITETIAVGGPEGKPFFIAGPYDNPDKIMAHLRRLLGPDEFHFTAPIDPATGAWLSHDDENWLEIESEG